MVLYASEKLLVCWLAGHFEYMDRLVDMFVDCLLYTAFEFAKISEAIKRGLKILVVR